MNTTFEKEPKGYKYFLKKDWTVELVGQDSYKRWKKKNPEFNISYKEYMKIWENICEEIRDIVVNDTNGLELPLYLGTLSVKKIEREILCKEDLPYSIYTDKDGIVKTKPILMMQNTNSAIIWKKNRRNRNVPGLLAMETNSVMRKKLVKKIKTQGDASIQLVQQTNPIPSKCAPYKDKSLFDL